MQYNCPRKKMNQRQKQNKRGFFPSGHSGLLRIFSWLLLKGNQTRISCTQDRRKSEWTICLEPAWGRSYSDQRNQFGQKRGNDSGSSKCKDLTKPGYGSHQPGPLPVHIPAACFWSSTEWERWVDPWSVFPGRTPPKFIIDRDSLKCHHTQITHPP